MNIFKRIDWRHTVWNADGTRAWARIAKTFALLLAFQMLGVITAIWLMHRNFEMMTPNIVGLLIADLMMIGGALFFVPEPEK